MQSYCDLTPKTKFMEEISHAHYPNYWKEKKFTKSNQSSIIDDEVEDTNTISNGKVIPSQIVMCRLGLEAPGRAKPSQKSPGQAGPEGGLDRAFGPACRNRKPEPQA